jgi:hypothetical protein
MATLNIQWTEQAWTQARRFLDFEGDWDKTMYMTSRDLTQYAQDFFTPYLHSVRSDPAGNGETARSVQPQVIQTDKGFEITYIGLISAYYMDVGNFPSGAVLDASEYGLKAFPVDRRFGNPFFAKTIHGMGAKTPGAPNHWSEETVKHMGEDGVAVEIALKHMNEFFRSVVITE